MVGRLGMIRSHLSSARVFSLVLIAITCGLSATPSVAQTDIRAAQPLLSSLDDTMPPEEMLSQLREARALLDAIVEDDPGSDMALSILRRTPVDGLDIVALDTRIATLSTALHRRKLAEAQAQVAAARAATPTAPVPAQTAPPSDPVPAGINPVAPPPVTIPLPGDPMAANATPETDTAAPLDMGGLVAGLQAARPEPSETASADVDLSAPVPNDPKTLMRLTQENLNRVGCEVGSADGVAGRKTRRGHEAYLKAQALSADLFPLGSADLLRHLIAATGTICEKLPPVALTPASMSGDWSFTTRCGANSRNRNKTFTGAFRLRHAGGGTYSGRTRMSNGIIGDISASLQGRSVNAVMNWGLLIGKTRMRGSVADEALVIYGRDDDRCRITARKR